MTIEQLREELNKAIERLHAAAAEVRNAKPPTDLAPLREAFAAVEAEVKECRQKIADAESIERALAANPKPEPAPAADPSKREPIAKGTLATEQVYRLGGEHSYLRDLLLDKGNDAAAGERLARSNEERRVEGMLYRDMSTAAGAGGEFLPPIYLANLAVLPSTSGRPFANALPTLPLPLEGVDISVPQLSSGISVANRADGGVVSETDGVTATISHKVRELAGQVDVGRIDVMRSNPAIDQIIVQMLVRRYNAELDNQLINGTGGGAQHIGLRLVTSPNTVSYADASPTAAELVPKLYDAIQKIDTNSDEDPDLMVAHPRRSAWLASNLSSTFPLFQLGGYFQAAGSQANGFVNNVAGLEVVADRNVGTTLGAGTEDEVYVLARQDFILMEGPLQTRVFEDVGSGTGTIRFQVFAHSAFLSNRYPKSLTIISGTGLIAPTF